MHVLTTLNKRPVSIFVAIFLLLMHAIKWIDLRMYWTICAKLYILNHSIACVRTFVPHEKLDKITMTG